MKKTIRLFLALGMLFCVSVFAYAASPASLEQRSFQPEVGEMERYGVLAVESAAESEQLEALLLEREEIAKYVMTSPSSNDPMAILIVLVVVSGVLFVGMTVISKIMKKKKK